VIVTQCNPVSTLASTSGMSSGPAGTMRQQVAAILSAARRRLRGEKLKLAAATVLYFLQLVPRMAADEEQGQLPLLREILTLYFAQVLEPARRGQSPSRPSGFEVPRPGATDSARAQQSGGYVTRFIDRRLRRIATHR
jgi:hypothetical protein